MKKENVRNKEKLKRTLLNVAPLCGMIILFFLTILLNYVNGNANSIGFVLENAINTAIPTIFVATGAIFIFSIGSFDISLGSNLIVSATIGGMVYVKTESFLLMMVTCIIVSVIISLINAVLAAVLNLPVFVTTIAMMSVLSAFASLLRNGKKINVGSIMDMEPFSPWYIKIGVLLILMIIFVLIFNFSPIGKMGKFMGGNPICARLTGISDKKTAIIAFALAGVSVGIGAFFSIIKSPTIGSGFASSVGMDMMIVIVFGGMALSGGTKSKIYAAIIGGLSLQFLNAIMLALVSGEAGNYTSQLVKGIVFLIVTTVIMKQYRTDVLTR